MNSDPGFGKAQYSLRTLLLMTWVLGLDLAGLVSGHWILGPALVITACLSFAIALIGLFRFRVFESSVIAALLILVQNALLGAAYSTYLLLFDHDRAMHSIGLGNPLSAAIFAIILGIPYAAICFALSCAVGFTLKLWCKKYCGLQMKGPETGGT